MAGQYDFRLVCTQQTKVSLTWQSACYLPTTLRAGLVSDDKIRAMPRAWGNSQRRLNRAMSSDPKFNIKQSSSKGIEGE